MIFDEKKFIGLLKTQEEILDQVHTLTEEIEEGMVGKGSYKISSWEKKKSNLLDRMDENSKALRNLVPSWNRLSEVKKKNLMDSSFEVFLSSIENKTLKIQRGNQPKKKSIRIEPNQVNQRINLAR